MGLFGSNDDNSDAGEKMAVNWLMKKLKDRQQRKEEERRAKEEAERKMVEETFHGKDDK